MSSKVKLFVLVFVSLIITANAAIVVAPSTALPEEKAKADILNIMFDLPSSMTGGVQGPTEILLDW